MFQEDIGLAPLVPTNLVSPGGECCSVVGSAPEPEIPPRGGRYEGRTAAFRFVLVHRNQGAIVGPKDLIHLLIKPGGMAELDRRHPSLWELRKKRTQSL